MDEEKRRAFLQRREELIREHGWMVQGVFPGPGASDEPESLGYSYTIGLHDKGLPELLVFSLSPDTARKLLNDVASTLLGRKALQLELTGKLEHSDWPVSFFTVHAEQRHAAEFAIGANARSEGAATYLQVVWPDKDGCWPWSGDASEGYLEAQPLLGEPPQSPRPN